MGMLLSTIWDVYGTWIILGAVIIGLVVAGVIVQRRSSRRRAKHATTAEAVARFKAGASQEQLERLSEQQLLVQLVTLQREMAEHQLRQNRQLSGINTGVTIIVVIIILASIFGCLSSTLGFTLLGL